jgi:hypothetical protein
MDESNAPLHDPASGQPTPEEPMSGQQTEQEGEDELRHPSVSYERRDAPFGWILVVAVCFVCLLAGVFAGIYAYFWADMTHLSVRRESEFPLAEHPSTALPVGPRLESIDQMAGISRPNVFLRQLAKEEQLKHYGPTQEKGFVHIPIDRAMQFMQLSAEYFPVRAKPPSGGKDNGLVDYGASNSGRMFRGTPP